MDIQEGSYRFSKSHMVYQGNEFSLYNLEMEVFPSEKGEMAAFAIADIKTKDVDLYPGVRDIKVSIEHEGNVIQIVDACVFDSDLNPASGNMSIEMMGKIEVPASSIPGSVKDETEGPKQGVSMEKDEIMICEVEKKRPDTKEIKSNLFLEVQRMSVAERIKLAMLGNKEVRVILIGDPNRKVQVAVLGNPRITSTEIERIASSRRVDGEVIRMIIKNREWVKNYAVKVALVKNPKTPVKDSMRFLSHLRDKDLKDVAQSKNVPNVLRVGAKKILSMKQKK